MALKKNGGSGYGIDSRIKRCKGRRASKNVVPVVNHAVRVAIGLGQKGFGLTLVVIPELGFSFLTEAGEHTGYQSEEQEQRRSRRSKPRAAPITPLVTGDSKTWLIGLRHQ